MSQPIYQIFVRKPTIDENGKITGLERRALVRTYTKFEYRIPFSDVGGWILDIPDDGNEAAEALKDVRIQGSGFGGIEVTRNGEIVFSGPVRGFTATGDYTSETGPNIQFFGADDTVYLASRVAMIPRMEGTKVQAVAPYDQGWGYWKYPSPGSAPRSIPEILLNLVTYNLGPAAPVSGENGLNNTYQTRRIPFLFIQDVVPFGPTNYRVTARYENLLDKVKEVANYIPTGVTTYFGAGFYIRQRVDGSLMFYMYNPNDNTHNKTETLVFSEGLRNLGSYRYHVENPQVNFSVVGGQGENALRWFEHKGYDQHIAKYGLWEGFLDRRDIQYDNPINPPPNTDYTRMKDDLVNAMTVQLQEEGEVIDLEVNVLDLPPYKYFTDYQVGDRVTVVIRGERIPALVKEATITLTKAEGEVITTVLGTQATGSTFKLYNQFNNSRQKIELLQNAK